MDGFMHVDLQQRHTFRLPATARQGITINSLDDWCNADIGEDYLILGAGSNTVFVEDYEGTIVQPGYRGVDVQKTSSGYVLTVGAAEDWHQLVEFCLAKNMPGFENLALIPGTVGAAPVQNIGAYGVEIADYIDAVHTIDLPNNELQTFTAAECQFGYRDSLFKRNPGRWLITHVVFRLPFDWQPNVTYPALANLTDGASAQAVFNEVVRVRQTKLPDPATVPNAGSFFKNPIVMGEQLEALKNQWPEIVYFTTDKGYKVAAGWLLDKMGFKGFSCGGIKVHDQQALVLINDQKGTGEQLLQLCQELQHAVKEQANIILEPEVRLIGQTGLKEELYPS